jgi:hypothetical protein
MDENMERRTLQIICEELLVSGEGDVSSSQVYERLVGEAGDFPYSELQAFLVEFVEAGTINGRANLGHILITDVDPELCDELF